VSRFDAVKRLPFGVVLAATLAACGPNHVAPFTPRQRAYRAGEYVQETAAGRPSNGSLFSEAHGGYLEDTRAHRVGDVVLVKIDESADASGTASTKLSREGEGSSGFGAFLGIVPALARKYPGMDTTRLVELASKAGFAGEGDTSRKGQLQGSVALRIVREMPNGDLFLEGTKVVLINHEEYHLYVSGLVRPTDIAQDNSVASNRVADAQVEFTGRGDVADQQRKGWLFRALDAVNPL
jgi:flagellar L-ring protein precursor FlgH